MSFAAVNGHPVTRADVYVPPAGPWWADVEFEQAPAIEGRVTIALGALELVGTVDPRHAGTHGAQRRARIVAGAGRWGALLAAKSYHNDAGVKSRTVAEDAAREAGETLDVLSFAPSSERLPGVDYVRQGGPASRALEDAIGGAGWWVGYDGRTRVGARPEREAQPDTYTLIDYDPRQRIATLAVDDLRAVQVGTVLADGLDEPQTVRELVLRVVPERVRVEAWTGGEATSRGRLSDALGAVLERATDRRLFGLYRYRVVQLSGDRVDLQPVRQDPGLPDIAPASMWPGVAGAHAELTPGTEVLVQFVEGDRAMPTVTGFAGKDGTGWTPASVTLSATTGISLGQAAEKGVARMGDSVEITIPKDAIASAVSGSAATGPTAPLTVTGKITGASSKVKSE